MSFLKSLERDTTRGVDSISNSMHRSLNRDSALMQEEEDEEADPTYVHVYEEFDDLQSDKAPMLSSNRPSSATSANKKKSFTAKVTQQVYKVFDEACRDINIVASAIDITENVQKSFLKSLNKAVSDVGRQVEKGINQAEKEITGAYNSVRSSPLLLKNLKKLGDQIGKDISRGMDSATKELNKAIHGSVVIDNFRTGNQLQLVARSSGRTLQIVTAPDGQIVPDGNGLEGPQVMNAIWTVTDLKNNMVTLHNNLNFLCVVNGQTQLRHYPATNAVGRETHFRVIQVQNNFVCLESVVEPGRHVGVLNTGQIKSAVACGRELDAHFGVRLIYSPYPPSSDTRYQAQTQTPQGKGAVYEAPPSYPGAGATGGSAAYPPAGPPPYKQ